MRLWGARFLGVFLGMSLEVGFSSQVIQLAEESDLIAAPQSCEKGLQECALRVRADRKKTLKIDEERRYVVGPSTNLFFKSPAQVRLLSGQLWIMAEEETIVVETPMGQFTIRGEAIVGGKSDDVFAVNLGGKVLVRALGAKEDIEIEPGMKNHLSGVSDGKARTGIPQMASKVEVLESLAQLFWGSRNQFRGWLQDHGDIWDGVEDRAAELHAALAEREVASENARAEREQAIARARAEERKKLRQMFFQKTFE